MSAIFASPTSRVRRFAATVAWLWRLGAVLDAPDRTAIGFGGQDEAVELWRLLRAGDLAGAVVFVSRPGPREGPVPGRHRRAGAPVLGPDCRLAGEFLVLDADGEPAVRSALGVHAVRDGNWIVFGADPEASWGAFDASWSLAALADFLVDVLDRPLAMLPPIGCARLDDVPGSAFHQLAGRDRSDREQRRRVERLAGRFGRVGGCLNLAIPPRTLVAGRETPVDEVWPRTVAAIGEGVRAGQLEPVQHGYLHLDTGEWAQGRLSPREFEHVEREEADRRLEIGLSWLTETFGEGRRTFVAPTWAYSGDLLDALAERGIPVWIPADLGPLVAGNAVRETVCSTMEGLAGLDYGPLGVLARAGLPPTVVVHGGLFDARLDGLRDRRQVVSVLRLLWRRDLFRAPWVAGVRWIGATEFVDRLRAHDRVVVTGSEATGPPGTEVVLRDRDGARTEILAGDESSRPPASP